MSNHLKSIPSPVTLAAILAWEFVGNAWSDMPAFNSIEAFVEDEANTIADRAAALRHMGKAGMGLEDEENQGEMTDEQYVGSYLDCR